MKKDWPKKLLADAYWFQEGPGVRKWQFCSSGIKLLNVANITKEGALDLSKTDRYLSKEEVSQKYSHFLANTGDLVIASSGISFDEDGLLRTRGAFIEQKHLPLCLNTSTIRFKSKKDISSLAWLRYWLDSVEFREQITRLVTGSAQQNFGPSHLKATKITLPPLAEQERIVHILDEADELRQLRAHADRRTADLIPALFQEMFGDPITNTRNWKREKFGDLLDGIDSGWSPTCHDKPAKHNEWGVLKLGAVTSCEYIDIENKALPEDFIPRPELEVKIGDLLFTRKNTYDLVAACAVVFNTRPKLMLSDLIFRFRLKSSMPLNPVFLWSLLTIPSKRKQVQALAGGSAGSMPNISKGRLLTLPIEVPPLAMQKEFAQRVAEIRQMEADQAASRTRLDALFHSLLHRAFEGEFI